MLKRVQHDKIARKSLDSNYLKSPSKVRKNPNLDFRKGKYQPQIQTPSKSRKRTKIGNLKKLMGVTFFDTPIPILFNKQI